MKSIVFVCQGNICRSAMAMFMLRNKLKELNLENEYSVTSAALESYTSGLDMDDRAKAELDFNHIPYSLHKAHQLMISEVVKADYVLCMQTYQRINIRRMMSSSKSADKVRLLLSYAIGEGAEIADPYYSGDFHTAYLEIEKGINAFIEQEILKK